MKHLLLIATIMLATSSIALAWKHGIAGGSGCSTSLDFSDGCNSQYLGIILN